MISRGYTNAPSGQVHWRMTGSGAQPDLYCLHPAPFSGLAFTTIMPYLATDRRVIAPDYPGHGGSNPAGASPSINDYALAILAVIDALSADKEVDLLGFHTGCLVAAELASMRPDRIRRIILIDIPCFDAEKRKEMFSDAAGRFDITPDLACLAAPWERGMTRRIESQGTARSFEMFTEQLRHGADMNAAFGAALSYDCESGFARITAPVTVIATQSALIDATRAAACIIPSAVLIERLDIKRAVLDETAETIAKDVLKGLCI